MRILPALLVLTRPLQSRSSAWRATPAAAAVLALCAAAAVQDVTSTLRATTPTPKLGAPILLTLEMRNSSKGSATYDSQQAALNGSLLVTGPDGKPVPYIATSFQTAGGSQTLAPGATVTIFKDLDLANQYLVDRAGTYTVQFRGGNGIPASAPIKVDVAAAPLPDATAFLAAVVRNAPAEWSVARYDRVLYLSDTRTTSKGNQREFSIQFQAADAAGPKGGVDLGMTRMGRAWVVAQSEEVKSAWPGYLDFVRAQLKPFVPTAPPSS